ncbi:MAG: hypothetical protein IIB57_16705, partial [Planctomycetes bacterium]|nr:hypothetical protein [Planctomycetota bacterium]
MGVLGAAVELTAEKRDAFLVEQADDDPQLLAELRTMLRVHEEAEKAGFLDPMSTGSLNRFATSSPGAEALIGDRIGP